MATSVVRCLPEIVRRSSTNAERPNDERQGL